MLTLMLATEADTFTMTDTMNDFDMLKEVMDTMLRNVERSWQRDKRC